MLKKPKNKNKKLKKKLGKELPSSSALPICDECE